MNIGQAIKFVRSSRGFDQVELAKRTGLSLSYISLIETGKRSPNLKTVESISTALGVPTFVLYFLIASPEEVDLFDKELAEKLSYAVLKIIRTSDHEK